MCALRWLETPGTLRGLARPTTPLVGHTQGLGGLEYGAAGDLCSTPDSNPPRRRPAEASDLLETD